MISQRALTACVRLMPSMFRISPYGRCAFTGTLAYVRTRIAGCKRPRRVHFAAALPRNASMKVRKDQLREQLARGREPPCLKWRA